MALPAPSASHKRSHRNMAATYAGGVDSTPPVYASSSSSSSASSSSSSSSRRGDGDDRDESDGGSRFSGYAHRENGGGVHNSSKAGTGYIRGTHRGGGGGGDGGGGGGRGFSGRAHGGVGGHQSNYRGADRDGGGQDGGYHRSSHIHSHSHGDNNSHSRGHPSGGSPSTDALSPVPAPQDSFSSSSSSSSSALVFAASQSTVKETVADHYNQRVEFKDRRINLEHRKTSRIYHLKNFNNWIKSVTIDRFVRRGSVVLDLCCGKGGDLLKYCVANCSYVVAADVAHGSVLDAVNRYNNIKARYGTTKFGCTFIAADCFGARLSSVISTDLFFDAVSCQFALHYSFETEARARALLLNVTERLKPGGYFFGTIPDANILIKNLRQAYEAGRNSFGNDVYSVKFDLPQQPPTHVTANTEQPPPPLAAASAPAAPPGLVSNASSSSSSSAVSGAIACDDEKPESRSSSSLSPFSSSSVPLAFNKDRPFGQKYNFTLEDAIDNCPEYLIHWPTFEKLASEYGLEVVLKQNFQDCFVENVQKPEHRELLGKMKVLNEQGTISQQEWEVTYLYLVFGFRKVGTPEPIRPVPALRSPRFIENRDVIVIK